MAQELGITEIAGQLAEHMPTRGVEPSKVKEAIRNTLYYAEDVGILDQLTQTIEQEAAGDAKVAALCDVLRER